MCVAAAHNRGSVGRTKPAIVANREAAFIDSRKKRKMTQRIATPSVRFLCSLRLPEDAANDFSADIGQAMIAALVSIGQLLVIDSEAVQDRRL